MQFSTSPQGGGSFDKWSNSMPTILIRGGTVVNADISERADVLIKDGKIMGDTGRL
jgi:hypothetical protein